MTARPESDQPQVGRAYAVEAAANQYARVRAARIVADRSVDVEDCRDLLMMLGLDTGVGRPSTDLDAHRV